MLQIYSLLGLIYKEAANGERHSAKDLGYDPQVLIVDYNVSAVEVYISFAKYIIDATRKLDRISASQNGNRMSGLPTWTPDWSQLWTAKCFLMNKIVNPSAHLAGSNFHAAGSTNAILRFSEDFMVLHVKGIRVDRITETWDRIFKFQDGGWVIDSQNCRVKCPKSA